MRVLYICVRVENKQESVLETTSCSKFNNKYGYVYGIHNLPPHYEQKKIAPAVR